MKQPHPIEIIPFSDDLQDYIKILNYEWLEKYFRIEEGDRVSLSDPKKEIIEKGGFIFYAKLNGEIVGTASLLKNQALFSSSVKWLFPEKLRATGSERYCLSIVSNMPKNFPSKNWSCIPIQGYSLPYISIKSMAFRKYRLNPDFMKERISRWRNI